MSKKLSTIITKIRTIVAANNLSKMDDFISLIAGANHYKNTLEK